MNELFSPQLPVQLLVACKYASYVDVLAVLSEDAATIAVAEINFLGDSIIKAEDANGDLCRPYLEAAGGGRVAINVFLPLFDPDYMVPMLRLLNSLTRRALSTPIIEVYHEDGSSQYYGACALSDIALSEARSRCMPIAASAFSCQNFEVTQ